MRIALAQMKVCPARPGENLRTMLAMIEEAKRDQADLVVFPEMAVPGLLSGEYLRNASFIRDCLACNNQLAEASNGLAVIFGNIVKTEDGLRNGCYLAENGYCKEVPASLGEEMIAGSYLPFNKEAVPAAFAIRQGGESYRIACLLGDWRGKMLPLGRGSVDLLLNLANLPFRLGQKYQPGKIALSAGCPLLFVNSCGLQNTGKANYLLPGGSAYYDQKGNVLAQAALFAKKLLGAGAGGGAIEPWPEDGELIFTALVEGVSQFMEAIGVKKAVIGLSGGIDSALAACVYVKALGRENVLLCNMPSRFNSCLTKNYARELSQALKTNYTVMTVEESLKLTKKQFAETKIIGPKGEEWQLAIDSFAEENLQSRDRSGRILATIAAAWGAIFTCNGNKSEAAVGYATFYGDLAGAFAAICDLWKHQVYAAALYAGRVFPEAEEALKGIAALKPSAELSSGQDIEKGLGDPLNYAYHDYLLAAWVEKEATPFEILELYRGGVLEEFLGCPKGAVKKYFPDAGTFIMDLECWWDRYRGLGIAKRLQAPPLLVMSGHPFGEAKGECQLPPYFGDDYYRLRQEILGQNLRREND